MKKDNDKKLTLSEKVSNYSKAIGLLVAAGIAVYGAFIKGEPQAQQAQEDVNQAWKKLQQKVKEQASIINKQSDLVERLDRRVVHIQGLQEGYNAGKLFEKLEQLQKENENLRKGGKKVKELLIAPFFPSPVPSPMKKPLPRATGLSKRLRKK